MERDKKSYTHHISAPVQIVETVQGVNWYS